MKCWNCGKENADDDIFCIYCGSKLAQEPIITEKVSEKRSVRNILEEYLPQLSEAAGSRGGFVITPNVDNENCLQKCEELMKDVLPGGKKLTRERGKMAIKSICENGETIQGVFVSSYNKLNYYPAVWFFSDRALYAFWHGQTAWYLQSSGKRKKTVWGCRCRYDAIDKVSVMPAKVSEGFGGLGTNKVSCSLLNSTDLFEFAFEKKYIREDKLLEMIGLLKC